MIYAFSSHCFYISQHFSSFKVHVLNASSWDLILVRVVHFQLESWVLHAEPGRGVEDLGLIPLHPSDPAPPSWSPLFPGCQALAGQWWVISHKAGTSG